MRPCSKDCILRRTLGRREEGVAAVEFALIMPFLLLLYFGSMEASALFTADKRVNSISATVGDLDSQWNPKDGKIRDRHAQRLFRGLDGAHQSVLEPRASKSSSRSSR